VVVLSVRDREEDKVAALDAGADDFSPNPLPPMSCWRACAPPNAAPTPARMLRSSAPARSKWIWCGVW